MAPITDRSGSPATKSPTTRGSTVATGSRASSTPRSTASTSPSSSRRPDTSLRTSAAPRATTIILRTTTLPALTTLQRSTARKTTTVQRTSHVMSTMSSTEDPRTSSPRISSTTEASTTGMPSTPVRPLLTTTSRILSTHRRTTPVSTTSRMSTRRRTTPASVTSPPVTASPIPTFTHTSPGGAHLNFSTRVPPYQQSQSGRSDSDGGSPNTAAIVVGILVPVILISLVALSVYYWYRRKYPVRMGIGRNFSTFSNPAYNKRASTVTLVREDGNKLFEELTKRSPEVVLEADEENMEELEGRENQGFDDEQAEHENLENHDGENDETGEAEKITSEKIAEFTTVEIETPKSAERPRKKAVLILSEENLDNGFELVTEDDLGKRRPSELSVGNDSTDTRTVSLSFSDIFDHRNSEDTKARSLSDATELYKSPADDIDSETPMLISKPRSQSDSFGVLKVSSSARFRKPSACVLSPITIPEKNVDSDEDDFVKIEEAVNKVESGETENVSRALLNEISQASGEMLKDSFEILNIESKSENETINDLESNIESLTEHQNVDENSDNEDDSPRDILNEKSPKRLSIQLQKQSIVLDTVPPTPTVIVQDSIIFEPETPVPVRLDVPNDRVLSPRRGRRAFTLNDILPKMTSGTNRPPSPKSADERSKSSPDIFLDDLHDTKQTNRLLDKGRENYAQVSVSDTDIAKDLLQTTNQELAKTYLDNSLEEIPGNNSLDINSAKTDGENTDTFMESIATESQTNSITDTKPAVEIADLFMKSVERESQANSASDIAEISQNDLSVVVNSSQEIENKSLESVTFADGKYSAIHSDANHRSDGKYPAIHSDANHRSEFPLEELKVNVSSQNSDLSESFEPINDTFNSTDLSFAMAINDDNKLFDATTIVDSQQESACDKEEEQGIIRASTPKSEPVEQTLAPKPDIDLDSDLSEPEDKMKTKILSGTFQFTMNDGEESDTESSSENNEHSDKSIDSTDYSRVQKPGSVFELESDDEGHDKKRSSGEAVSQYEDTMKVSMDSGSSYWEVIDNGLNKSANESDENKMQQSKANISWDMVEDTEDNSEC